MQRYRERSGSVAALLAAESLALSLSTAGPALAQSCVTPNDCLALNGPCSLGACIANQCQRQTINEGDSCTTPNPCVTPAFCNAGYCVGDWQLNCCNDDGDCNDYNPCTTDTCVSSSCVRGNAPVGAFCGSQVDDACTGPDTCDGSRNCQTNDSPEGADCGGPDCVAGECGPLRYRAQLLPEGGNIGSEPRGMSFLEGDPDQPIIVGRVVDGNGMNHAVVWDRSVAGEYDLLALEGAAGTPSVANDAECDDIGACVAVGAVGLPPQPAAWVFGGATWSAEPIPLPPGATGGVLRSVKLNNLTPQIRHTAVGATTAAEGARTAAYWERNNLGNWSAHLLPCLVQTATVRSCAAEDVLASQLTTPPEIGLPGARLISGWAEDGPGVARPVIWRETDAGSGVFDVVVLPLPQGAVASYHDGSGDTTVHEVGHWLDFKLPPLPPGPAPLLSDMGTVALVDGSKRGVVWTTADFLDWNTAVPPPLPGLDDTYSGQGDVSTLLTQTGRVFSGTSVPAGGDPLLDGALTQWTLETTTLGLISGPTDTNVLTSGLPVGCRYTLFNDFPSNLNPVSIENSLVGSVVCPSVAAGTLQPHAAVAVALGPAGIPTLSTWGLVLLALVVTCAATVMLLRRRSTVASS